MAKRSVFPRIPKDQYMTIDPRAALALDNVIGYNANHEDNNLITFAEPCSGNGDLIRGLEATGNFICLWASDKYIPQIDKGDADWISWTYDAMDITKDDMKDVDMIITNPPWSRDILHPLIEHLASLKPTWLLFDADWMHTKQSSDIIKRLCTDIISIGRLKWIPDTTMVGKDNCAWYKFDFNKMLYPQVTVFHGR